MKWLCRRIVRPADYIHVYSSAVLGASLRLLAYSSIWIVPHVIYANARAASSSWVMQIKQERPLKNCQKLIRATLIYSGHGKDSDPYKIRMTMWYFSFSFIINLQKNSTFLYFSVQMGCWVNINDTKNELFWILANGCNETKSETFKGVWILSVPTVYSFGYSEFRAPAEGSRSRVGRPRLPVTVESLKNGCGKKAFWGI